jgi:peptidoglycan/LPS O-acetylase OafA/YrhL
MKKTHADSDPAPVVPSTGERFYRPELDCLRFFAFFAVFIFHTMSPDPAYWATRHVPCSALLASAVSAGRFGVDLFFLLSAYLITELLLREQDRFGKLNLRSFYVRRILRIWPLYFLGIGIAVVLARIAPADQHFPPKYAVAFLLMAGNWLPYTQSVMWPLWSVSFEEQFYLLWPALLSHLALARHRHRILYASGVLLLIATIARPLMARYAGAMSQETIFTSSLTRLDPLAIGIATAVVLHKKKLSLESPVRIALLAAGCGFGIAAGHFWSMSTAFLSIGYPSATVASWLIFRSALGLNVAPRWLRYLGKVSYGLYVFHMLALYCVLKLLGGPVHDARGFLLYWTAGLSLTVAMAAVSYRFLESPFLALKERFASVQSRPV